MISPDMIRATILALALAGDIEAALRLLVIYEEELKIDKYKY